jgi:hypothetical protein
MKNDRWVKRWKVPGSNGNTWTVAIDKEGNYGCSCPRWKFKREQCHHVEDVKAGGGTLQGGDPVKQREAIPGNVAEVTIDGDRVLYPLVPFGGGPDLPATIVYDLIRANVSSEKVRDYATSMFRGASLKQIKAHVEAKGRYIYSRFEKGKGWVAPVHVPCDLPLKTLRNQ